MNHSSRFKIIMMPRSSPSHIHIRRAPGAKSRALVVVDGVIFSGIMGRSSTTSRKLEGDGATPIGSYEFLFGLWRQDRMRKPRTLLDMKPVRDHDGWCDDPTHPRYNQLIKISPTTNPRHEILRREDHIYDIILVIAHNIRPRIRNRGSAIFIHLQSPDHRPTQGCIALSLRDMKRLLSRISRKTIITIHP